MGQEGHQHALVGVGVARVKRTEDDTELSALRSPSSVSERLNVGHPGSFEGTQFQRSLDGLSCVGGACVGLFAHALFALDLF